MSLVRRIAEAVRLAAARAAYPSDEHFRRAVELGGGQTRLTIEALDLDQIISAELGKGKWQREMPTAPGKYWVRNSDGDDAGLNTICVFTEGEAFCPEHPRRGGLGGILPGTVWRGWWWSEPIDQIPPFPG